MPGRRGRSPRRNKLWDSPFPSGEGGRGDGGSKASQRQGWWATKKANHPLGTTAAGIAGKQKGAPRGTCVPRGAPRAKKPGNLLNYLLSFLITRLS